MPEHTEDAAALLRSLEAAPAVVIGRSYGGEVALDLAMRHPDLAQALVLLEAPPKGPDSEVDAWLERLTVHVLEIAGTKGVEAVGEAFIRAVLGDDAWEGLPAEWQRVFVENGQAIVAECRGGDLEIDMAALATLT